MTRINPNTTLAMTHRSRARPDRRGAAGQHHRTDEAVPQRQLPLRPGPTPVARPLPAVDTHSKRQDRHQAAHPEQLERYQPWLDNARRLRELTVELEALTIETVKEAEGWGREADREVRRTSFKRSDRSDAATFFRHPCSLPR